MTISVNVADTILQTDPSGKHLANPDDLVPLLEPFRNRAQEHFVLITLDALPKLIAVHTVFIGTAETVPIHPREIFRLAILDNAAGIVVAHNHPSGDCSPSQADLEITAKLYAASRIMGIPLLDDMIVSKNCETSLLRTYPELFEDDHPAYTSSEFHLNELMRF